MLLPQKCIPASAKAKAMPGYLHLKQHSVNSFWTWVQTGSLGHVSRTLSDGSYHSRTAGQSHWTLVNAWCVWGGIFVHCVISNYLVRIAFCRKKGNTKMLKTWQKTSETLNYDNENREKFVQFHLKFAVSPFMPFFSEAQPLH